MVYITKTAHFLPNAPVSNENMTNYLGLVNNLPSKTKNIVLRNNGINQRYYALDAAGNTTHTNAQLANNSIKNLEKQGVNLNDIDLLSCGTTLADQFLPSHASMVHGLLNTKPIELNSATGVCCAGMSALKYAYLSVLTKQVQKAIACGSEKASGLLKANKFEADLDIVNSLEAKPNLAFNKDFLRFMLSDGAGCFLLENNFEKGTALKIEWIDFYSYAHELPTCMYAGADFEENGTMRYWQDMQPTDWLPHSIFSIKQNVKLLDENILKKGVESFEKSLEKHPEFKVKDINHFLVHLSSYYFKEKLQNLLAQKNINIPDEKWFTNLKTVGNIGAASIYVMLDELFHSNKLKHGDKIVLVVPESGRFNYAICLLTCCQK
ncbi:MAG: beta-ketoacyl-ACP synthase III [Alphaproteobacteria bacterium]|nr:beta-ketoacyl-ACP synthase III [Alphaproteobacteria bacterium]